MSAERDILLDFVTHPYWDTVTEELARLIQTLLVSAALCEKEKHDFERGRLDGAKRALLVLDEWRKNTKKELIKDARVH